MAAVHPDSVTFFDFNTSNSRTCSSEHFWDTNMVTVPFHGKTKRVMAAVGYSTQNPLANGNNNNSQTKRNTAADKEEAEQFCYSMLGEECKLGVDVIRDVLYQCEYDIEKALDVLLDISRTSSRNSIGCGGGNGIPKFNCRSYSEALTLPKGQATQEGSLPEQVLNSLFRTPKTSAQQHDDDMNWKDVVKKMAPFGQGSEFDPYRVSDIRQRPEHAKEDDYKVFRKGATQQYEAQKLCSLKASTAYSSGQKGYAAYLSQQGKVHNKVAREADEKASQDIFVSRNKGIQNTVTIDLHGQHVKQAINLLKVHILLFTTYVPSVQNLRVITGHGVGKNNLKKSVIELIQKAGVQWSEENRGSIMMKLDGHVNVNFAESEELRRSPHLRKRVVRVNFVI